MLPCWYILEDVGWYTLGLTNQFDDYTNFPNKTFSTRACGGAGLLNGVTVKFSVEDIEEIPYRQQIEIPFAVKRDSYACHEFNDISVQLVSTCEQNTTSSAKRQYDSKTSTDGTQVIDYARLVYPDDVLATFSVTWPADPPPSLLVTGTRSLGDNRFGVDENEDSRVLSVSFNKDELAAIAESATRLLGPQIKQLGQDVQMQIQKEITDQLKSLQMQIGILISIVLVLVAAVVAMIGFWIQSQDRLNGNRSSSPVLGQPRKAVLAEV